MAEPVPVDPALAAFLALHPPFDGLDSSEVERVAQSPELRRFRAGE